MDENNTANILLCLGEKRKLADDPSYEFTMEDIKGDLVDQLKHSVRQEAADKKKWLLELDEPASKSKKGNDESSDAGEQDLSADEKLRYIPIKMKSYR